MGLPQRDAVYHTYGDYLEWPEDVRYELIDGVAYLMSPAPMMSPARARDHQEIAGELYYQARAALEGQSCRAYVSPFDVRLPKGEEPDKLVEMVVQPDVLVVCDRKKLDERGMRGAPDWIVEVLSPTTAAHDQTVKLAAYERAGVREVWLVHPSDRVLTIYRLEGTQFSRPLIQELKGQTVATSVPGLTIDWDRVLARLD